MSKRFPNKYDRKAPASAAREGPRCDKVDAAGGGEPCRYTGGHAGPCLVGGAHVFRNVRPKTK